MRQIEVRSEGGNHGIIGIRIRMIITGKMIIIRRGKGLMKDKMNGEELDSTNDNK